MEINHFSHPHPLVRVEDKSDQVREAYCSGCRELIRDSSTYRCAELPKELDHPFHPQHPLVLYDKPQYDSPRLRFKCNSCRKRRGETFVYHCSACQFDLDIQCALLPKLITGDFPKLQHFSHQHSLLFIEKHYIESADESCFACEDPISGPIYCCFDCKVFLHRKCTELPPEINHPSHRKHPLTLMPNPPPPSHSKHSLALQANYPHKEYCSCHLCGKLPKGFVYYCSPCEFCIRIKYTFSHLFEAKTHEHPFTLLSRPMSFICDACGTCGEYCMPYICNICNLVVHKDCISLPHTIKLRRHEHSVFHSYFLKENEVRKRICRICRKDVNVEYGSYHCLGCDYFVHVNCARDRTLWDNEILEMEELNQKSSETLGKGEIKNFSHDHKLLRSDKMKNCEYYCNGCRRSISTAFYHCAECNYFLHKCCAELPTKKKHWWAEKIRTLNFKDIFWCYFCGFYCSGFFYVNDDDRVPSICIRCFEIPDYYLAHGHDHYLLFDHKFTTECSICNEKNGKYKCEDDSCEFVLCRRCIALPETAWYKHDGYKHDEHPLALTYYDDVHDSDQCFCDTCEEPRDPKKWFYYCATCDYSCHPRPCALGWYPYVKLGSPVKLPIHEHPLTFMKDNLGYHKCGNCGKSCKDAFLKCLETECKYLLC